MIDYENVARAICNSAEADDFDKLDKAGIVYALYMQQAKAAIAVMQLSTDMFLAWIQERMSLYHATALGDPFDRGKFFAFKEMQQKLLPILITNPTKEVRDEIIL